MSLATFAEQVLADFNATAAIAPSSPSLVKAMVEPLPLAHAKVVIELGPGTGVMTRQLLQAIPKDAKLIAFELNQRFVKFLHEQIQDPRLLVLHAGAETASQELQRMNITRVDAVLSSLGFSMMRDPLPDNIVGGLTPFMNEDSVFTQFQYVQRMRFQDGRAIHYDVAKTMRRHFKHVNRRVVLLNLPPAFVYDCTL